MKHPKQEHDIQATINKVDRGISLLEQAILGAQKRSPKTTLRQLHSDGHKHSVRELQPYALSIAHEYINKASLRELAAKYHATLPTISAVLESRGVKIRTSGRIAGKDNPAYEVHFKLTSAQREWALQQDNFGTQHAEIAEKLNISRERIRQICLEAGHPPRREVMREQREQRVLEQSAQTAINRARREATRAQTSPTIEKAAKLWAKDKTIEEIAEVLGSQANTVGVQIARWRKRWPDLFPRRYVSHEHH